MDEFAFFTPTEITGTGVWLDLWNADLWWGMSDLDRLVQQDRVLFRKDAKAYAMDYEVGATNGVVQATFDMPNDGYVIAVAKVSSNFAPAYFHLDKTSLGVRAVNTQDMDLPFTFHLTAGRHYFTIQQLGGWIFRPKDHLWFHSLTLFEV